MTDKTIRTSASDENKPAAAPRKWRSPRPYAIVRCVVQLSFFLVAPSLFSSAFLGVKQLFIAVGHGQPLPWNSFVQTLAALCLYTVLFGRWFCGYACSFGALGDLVYGISCRVRRKRKKKPLRLPEKAERLLRPLPYLLLLAVILLCASGLWSKMAGWSPWDVFSQLCSLRFGLSGYVPGIVLLALIVVGMAFEPRFFCRFLCPMGAVFRLLPILPWAVLRRDRSACLKGCSACQRVCPMGHTLGEGEDGARCNAGDCIRCGICAADCPKSNVRTGIPALRGHEHRLTAVKALLLLGLAWALGLLRIL